MEDFFKFVDIVDQFMQGTCPGGRRARALAVALGIVLAYYVLYGKENSFYDQWQQDHKNITMLTAFVSANTLHNDEQISSLTQHQAKIDGRVTVLEDKTAVLHTQFEVLNATAVKTRNR